MNPSNLGFGNYPCGYLGTQNLVPKNLWSDGLKHGFTHGHLGSNSATCRIFCSSSRWSADCLWASLSLRRFDQPNSRIHVQKSSKTIWRYSRGSRIDMNWWEVEDFSVSHLVWTILQKMQPPPSSHGKKQCACSSLRTSNCCCSNRFWTLHRSSIRCSSLTNE